MNKYSVLLVYPDYIADDYPRDTYFAYVETENPKQAIIAARKQAIKVNKSEHGAIPEDDFLPILCVSGWPEVHFSEIWNR